MHDLVREVAIWVVNKEIQAVNFSNKNQKSLVERDKNIKYLLCEGKNLMDLLTSKFDGSKLEILMVNMDTGDHVNIPISFFENIVGLRVLYLSLHVSDDWLAWPTLSLQPIHSLKNIRSILVERVNLGDISILGNLESLETLDLTSCEIQELPHEITKLEKFRLLKLEHCRIINNNPFDVIKRCSSLEELYFIDSFNDFRQEITLPVLQRYCLIDDFKILKLSLSKCVSLQHDYFSEASFKYVMQTAELLYLEGIERGWSTLMPEIVPFDQGMNDLIELRLKDDLELQCLIDTKQINSHVPNVFSKLVVLYLNDMENLEELCNGPISFNSLNDLEGLVIESCNRLQSLFKCSLNLCNLKTMKLTFCSELVSVFDLSTSRSLLLLENLVIFDCRKLENIFSYERRVDDEIEEILVDGDNDTNKSCNSMFPKLKVVNIYGCPRLQFIFPLLSGNDLLLLESITVECCHDLKYIFGQHQEVELASLTELQLHDLPNFIDIFPAESYHSMPSSIRGSSNFISMPQTLLVPNRSSIFSWSHICCYKYKLKGSSSAKVPLDSKDQPLDCSISTVSNLNHLAQCLSRSTSHIACNIKVIKLANLPKMKSVFILSIAPKTSLETLTIKNCDELEQIIVHIGNGSGGNNWGNNAFPKLKELNIKDCEKLEYIFGHSDASDGHQNHNNEVIHLHLPALECLKLRRLPSLIGMCTKNYRTMLPSLTVLKLVDCSPVDIKSIGDVRSIKQSSGNMEHSLTLKRFVIINNSKVECIFCLNEVNGQPMNLELQNIELHDLSMMMCLFVGPKNSISLENLTWIKIVRCDKMEIVFSTSIIRCLPQLCSLRIEECNELKHIIEDDLENKTSSNFVSTNTCFPKLETLVVGNCNKLKCVFPIFICNELPELKCLLIREADELEEIFKSKVEIPNLKFVAFVNLPSLFQTQGIQFQDVQNRCVQNCEKLALSSTSSTSITIIDEIYKIGGDMDGIETRENLLSLFRRLGVESNDSDSGSEYPSSETSEDFTDEIEVEAELGQRLTSSQIKMKQTLEAEHEFVENVPDLEIPSVLRNEQSMSQQCLMKQQHSLVEINTNIKLSQGNNLEGSTSEKTAAVTLSTKQKVFPHVDGQIVIPSFSISKTEPFIKEDIDIGEYSRETTQTNNNQDFDLYMHMVSVYQQFQEMSKGHDNGNENPSAQTTKEFAVWVVAEAASRQTLTSSKELMNKQSMDQQCLMNQRHPFAEPDTTIKPSQEYNLEGSTSEINVASTLCTISEMTRNELPIQLVAPKQKGFKISIEEGTTSANEKTITSSPHSKSAISSLGQLATSKNKTTSEEDCDGQRTIASPTIAITKHVTAQDVDVKIWQETSKTNDDQVSLNDDVVMKVSSNIEDQFSKDDEILVSKSRLSFIASRFPSKPSEEDPSHVVDDLSSSLLVTRELEQLVSMKHLAIENLSLLTDFLVKHHYVLLKDTLSYRYKGYAYNCLAELLKFLQTHSVLDVLGSSHSEFVELVQDVGKFSFDKDWLDSVEKRALFPGLQFSQDAFQKILYSKKQVTKEVEEMRLKINILNQHVQDLKHQLASSEAILESIIQQEAQVLEIKATLSSPLGY